MSDEKNTEVLDEDGQEGDEVTFGDHVKVLSEDELNKEDD